jgi:hypothetical protein
MNILSQLLPGLRDLRTPLAVGYVWLTALYFFLSNQIPEDPSELGGIYREIYRLSHAAGLTATLAAVTFLAYLVGILSIQLQTAFLSIVRSLMNVSLRHMLPKWYSHEYNRSGGPSQARLANSLTEACVAHVTRLWDADEGRTWRTKAVDMLEPKQPANYTQRSLEEREKRARASLLQWVKEQSLIAARIRRDITVKPRAVDRLLKLQRKIARVPTYPEYSPPRGPMSLRDWIRDLYAELPRLPNRLLGKDSDLWAEWDKRRAEGEFRLGLVPPVLALGIVLGVTIHPAWLLLVLPSALLVISGVQQEAAAAHVLLSSVAAGRIESQELSRREYKDIDVLVGIMTVLRAEQQVYRTSGSTLQSGDESSSGA